MLDINKARKGNTISEEISEAARAEVKRMAQEFNARRHEEPEFINHIVGKTVEYSYYDGVYLVIRFNDGTSLYTTAYEGFTDAYISDTATGKKYDPEYMKGKPFDYSPRR